MKSTGASPSPSASSANHRHSCPECYEHPLCSYDCTVHEETHYKTGEVERWGDCMVCERCLIEADLPPDVFCTSIHDYKMILISEVMEV